MNATDLRKLKPQALQDRLADLKEELFNLRFQHAINQLENPNKLRDVKRDIARVKTIIRANEMGVEQGYAELDALEVPVQDEKPVKKTRAKAVEESAEKQPAPSKPARSRKTVKPEIKAEDDGSGVQEEKAEEAEKVLAAEEVTEEPEKIAADEAANEAQPEEEE